MERHVNPEDPDLYALGALDGEEKRAFEAHVRSCAACAVELAAARERVALLALAAPPAAPAPSVKEELMRRVRAERSPSAAVPVPAAPARPPRRASGFAWLTPAFATAAIVFAVLAGWLWTRNRQYAEQVQSLQSQLTVAQSRSLEIARAAEETNQLLGMPGTVRVSLAQQPGAPSGRAGLLYNPRMGMVMCAGKLAPAPAGKSYQLWMVPATGAPMSLAVFSSADPTRPMMAHVPVGLEAKAFAITVEPEGGMPQPTGPKVFVGVAG